MSGQILGDRYEVEQQIGKQAGRWTLLARDLKTQEQVVAKLLFIDEEVEWDDLKLFEREVETLKALSHPLIPQYLGYFEQELPTGKALVLLQNYIEGKSLESYIQEKRVFSEAEAKPIAKTLLGILNYLHKHQPPVIHRDIKPSNIMLAADGQVYLIDFGSVKSFGGGDNSAFTVVGTYGYMPPEQFSGRAIAASDLFSLGATLIALVTGTHPSSLPRKGVKVDFGQVVQLSPAFADWLNRITEPSLERRFKSAEEALQALEGKAVAPAKVVSKPGDSKISLGKDISILEISIPSRFGQTQLKIDPQQISLTSKRLGINIGRPQVASRRDISQIECQPQTAKVILTAGQQKFELNHLTVAEANWLAYELSSWLKLPIQS